MAENDKNESHVNNIEHIQQPAYKRPVDRTAHNRFLIHNRTNSLQKIRYRIIAGVDNIGAHLSRLTLYEYESGIGFNLLPVFVAIGIAIYFYVPAEPSLWALLATFGSAFIISIKSQRFGKGSVVIAGFAAIVLGMLAAKIATVYSGTPIIERQITAQIEGVVLRVDQNRRGSPRYIVQPLLIENLSQEQLPKRVRLSAASKHSTILPGQGIKGLARLQPVSGPVYPGGYDFSFFSWYEGLGGSGFFLGKPAPSIIHTNSLQTSIVIGVNRFRRAIEDRIYATLPGTTGAIAIALVTGNKTKIPEDIQNSLRVTGLAHILAISGLHMALVTLTVIWVVRALLVRISNLSLHFPIKKIAIGVGFISASFYLFISGGGIATQRAWIMISVMLLAAFMDRRAITMRSVAVSALIILLISPQTLLAPGFQMSFAAVASLVAGYEVLNKRREAKQEKALITSSSNWVFGKVKTIITYFLGIGVTSLIAGTATGFIAAWHFNQIAPFGLITNILAMPIVTILVMPFVLASVLLMPYGLEFIALIPVSFGLEQVIAIAKEVEAWSPANATGLLPQHSIIVFALFLAALTVFKTKLRFLAFAILPFALIGWEKDRIPDIIVAENGRSIAVKSQDGNLSLLNTRRGGFVQDIWQKAWAPNGLGKIISTKEDCDRDRCIHQLSNGKSFHLVYDPSLLQSSCKQADILIAPRLWWVNCFNEKPDFILTRNHFEQNGTHAIYIEKSDQKTSNNGTKFTLQIETGLSSASRPWTRNVQPK